MTIEELIKHSKFIFETLNMQCAECQKEAKDFHKSVIKYLEALKIIKDKLVDVGLFVVMNDECVEVYNKRYINKKLWLTKEEFDLLKEVLGNNN